jgi:DMSO/TMAO reductase YedYZ molybdopterin-dependent catalytic subunit
MSTTETAQDEGITLQELQLAARNHGMPLEALVHDLTPVGLHYLLIHFDIPMVDEEGWQLSVGGHVRSPLELTLEEMRALPAVSQVVTMECAGNGRARLVPRPLSQPWLGEAVGTAEWTGTPLGPILDRAGILDGAVEVVFTGEDRGVQGEVEQQYERSLTLDEARRPEVLLVYAMNGRPLLPQHGFPLRLLVPGWYGMTSVKWLRSITAVTEPFAGYQQAVAYRITQSEEDPGQPVSRIQPRSLMIPPGIPEFFTRARILQPTSECVIRGRAWSGWGAVVKVEVSTNGGSTWSDATLSAAMGTHAWTAWSFVWDASSPGEYELCSRATDAAGNIQPVDQPWNLQGLSNNMVQRVQVIVGEPPSGSG